MNLQVDINMSSMISLFIQIQGGANFSTISGEGRLKLHATLPKLFGRYDKEALFYDPAMTQPRHNHSFIIITLSLFYITSQYSHSFNVCVRSNHQHSFLVRVP